MKTENSKLKQIKRKTDSENNNKTADNSQEFFSNEVLEQMESDDNFENFFNRFIDLFADKSTQTMDALKVPEVVENIPFSKT